MRPTYFWLGALFVLGLAGRPAAGRLIENWPYERLFKEADLVVIAEATAVADADDPAPFERVRDLLQAQVTTFAVEHALKGKPAGAEIRVLHFRLNGKKEIDNGPMLVAFRTKPAEVALRDGPTVAVGKGTYLLFLKVRKDGRYEPVSGQYDPVLSVRELDSPMARLAGK